MNASIFRAFTGQVLPGVQSNPGVSDDYFQTLGFFYLNMQGRWVLYTHEKQASRHPFMA